MRARRLPMSILAALAATGVGGALWSASASACPNEEIRQAQSSSFLPGCRAYELVSPPGDAKGGANIGADPARTKAAVNGDAIAFDSLAAFGDASGYETLGAEYVSQRSPDGSGWTTHAINPEQNSQAMQLFRGSRYVATSEDLSKGVYYALSPVTSGHANVEKAENLYLRDDILSAPPGSYELLSDSVEPLPTPSPNSQEEDTQFAAASSDWSHILFESIHNLTSEAQTLDPTRPKVYEWHEGILRLAGILPNGEPAEASMAGRGARGAAFAATPTIHTISEDGSRIVFDAPRSEAATNLYMRIDGATTIKLNVSERSELDPNGEQSAQYAASTPDDSKVLFISSQALTDDAPVGANEGKLYMYDLNAPAGKHLTLISVDHEPASAGSPATGVAAVSDDGEYVYFIGDNSLLPGIPAGFELYVWHDGTVRAIASYDALIAESRGVRWGEGSLREGDTLRMSSDGKTIAFLSADPGTAQSVGYDNLSEGCHQGECGVKYGGGLVCIVESYGCDEIYIYSYDEDKLTCASCDPNGARPVSDAGANLSFKNEEGSDISRGLAFRTNYLNRFLSVDGRFVFFDTSDALVSHDTNARRDVYMYDALTGEVHLITSGTCACDAHFVDATPDGSDVFFVTRQRLVSADIDVSGDMYDARIDGGIAGQNQSPPAACAGEECQGPAPSAPAFSLPASATFAGVGNAPPVTESVVKVRSKPSKARKLARALRACRKKSVHKRARCEAKARRRYGAKQSAKHATRRSGR